MVVAVAGVAGLVFVQHGSGYRRRLAIGVEREGALTFDLLLEMLGGVVVLLFGGLVLFALQHEQLLDGASHSASGLRFARSGSPMSLENTHHGALPKRSDDRLSSRLIESLWL